MGKTTYLDWLIFNHLPVSEKERNRIPIIGIQAPESRPDRQAAPVAHDPGMRSHLCEKRQRGDPADETCALSAKVRC